MAPDMATLLRSHWYENVASSMPSASVMVDVTAVSVLPVVAVPLMVGSPVADGVGIYFLLRSRG